MSELTDILATLRAKIVEIEQDSSRGELSFKAYNVKTDKALAEARDATTELINRARLEELQRVLGIVEAKNDIEILNWFDERIAALKSKGEA